MKGEVDFMNEETVHVALNLKRLRLTRRLIFNYLGIVFEGYLTVIKYVLLLKS